MGKKKGKYCFWTALLFLFIQAASSQTRSILFTPQSMMIRDDSVRIEMKITIRGIQLPTERSLSLTPYLCKSNKNVTLPSVILYGRQRYRFDRREELIDPRMCLVKPYTRLVGLNEKKTYTLQYKVSLPYAGWMRHASLCLRQTGKDCCTETRLSDNVLTEDIHLPDPCIGEIGKGGEP
ncbi:DUF3868 domain-containing protein [uncultured Parabacteroides sp.]|uniref:DUF3868 domain-containing protein n=1 Tax=uncultured Parabacteroides sp. TaxID=512312 RepID=UPI0025EB65C2|nr:DUF3868 domain-containing protein [uncultured Parabacteroides sp.]